LPLLVVLVVCWLAVEVAPPAFVEVLPPAAPVVLLVLAPPPPQAEMRRGVTARDNTSANTAHLEVRLDIFASGMLPPTRFTGRDYAS
jgi:hypothetical protein